MEGSEMYKNLEANARRFYVSNDLLSRGSSDNLETLPLGSIIVKLLGKINADYDTFKKKEKDLLPPDGNSFLTF